VFIFFKDLLTKINTNAFLKDSIYHSLQKAIKVVCPNPIICKYMEVETFEAYKELLDKTTRARRAKSFTEVLSLLYTGEINTFAGFSSSPEKAASKLVGLFSKKFSSPSKGGFAILPKKSEDKLSRAFSPRDSVTYDELR
jgi:hypothetical protein